MSRATRRSADGRNGTHCYDVAVHQVHAATVGSGFPRSRSARSTPHPLEPDELTILTAWAEAVAELAYAPGRAAALLAEARSGAAWRADLSAANEHRSAEPQLASLVRQVPRAMLEERRTRQPASGTSAVRAD